MKRGKWVKPWFYIILSSRQTLPLPCNYILSYHAMTSPRSKLGATITDTTFQIYNSFTPLNRGLMWHWVTKKQVQVCHPVSTVHYFTSVAFAKLLISFTTVKASPLIYTACSVVIGKETEGSNIVHNHHPPLLLSERRNQYSSN